MKTTISTKTAVLFMVWTFALIAAPVDQFIREPVFDEGIYARSVKVGTTTTLLAALPTFYSFSLGKNLAADMGVIPAAAVSDIDHSTILRVANTKLRLSYNFCNAVLATFGCRIPTGFNQFSGEQLVTAGNLATRQCDFQYANLFNSFDLFGGVATSAAFTGVGKGDLSIGLGAAYLYKGAFQPSASINDQFDPGDELNLSIAANYTVPVRDRTASFLADIGYTYFGPDRFGATEETVAGSKFNWALSAQLGRGGTVPFSVRLANYRKGATIDRSRLGETGRNANDLLFTAVAPLRFAAALQPYVKLGAGSYSGGGVYPADSADVKARIGSIGLGGSARCTEHLFASLETGVDAGTMGTKSVLGVEFQAGITFRF
jgi:hypothetical protein